MSLRAYYNFIKPGIVYGNLITAVAGYFLAAGLHFRFRSLVGAVVGIALVMGSACAINNLADRDIDVLMERTKKRPSVSGAVGFRAGLIYAAVLALAGFLVLALLTNLLCVVVGLIGYLDYALLYTYSKRKTYHATLIGSLSGAAPIVGGYVAYSDHLSVAALIIGAMMLVWQMPHFYSIAMYRGSDYKKAHIPVMPAVLGRKTTGIWMVGYSVLFLLGVLLLYFYGPVGVVYLVVMALVALLWLAFNIRGAFAEFSDTWAKKNFRFSLIVMLALSLSVALR